MIKIIAIDLDGTLFDKNKNISKENKQAIKIAHEMGVKIVIATGRPISGAMPVLEELGLTTDSDYAIIYNGAKIFNVGTKQVIYTSSITGFDVKKLYEESLRHYVFIHAFRENEELIASVANPYTDVEASLNKIKEVIVDFTKISDDEKFLKCMMVDCDEKLNATIKNINPFFYNNYSMVRSSKIFLEFLNKRTHKGAALKTLAEYLDIDIKDTMAIGDADNDLSMIRLAGIGVAMANAFPEIKEEADFITTTNEESGVAMAIEKFIINRVEK